MATAPTAPPPPPPWPANEAKVPNTSEIAWSRITPSLPCLEKLRLLCHSQKELEREGYVTKPLSAAEIEAKARCMRCGKRAPRRQPQRQKSKASTGVVNGDKKTQTQTDLDLTLTANVDTKEEEEEEAMDENEDETPNISTAKPKKKSPPPSCTYHTGVVRNKAFTCCGQHVTTGGCIEALEHTLPEPDDPLLHKSWQFYTTPPNPAQLNPAINASASASANGTHGSPLSGPRRRGHKQGRGQQQQQERTNQPRHLEAIALDCETGVAATGHPELIRLTAVDFFSGAVLIDKLVAPAVAMTHYNTRFSGVTAADMREAVRTRTAILGGRDRARDALFRGGGDHRRVGPDTIVVVHGGCNDFTALRWIHPLVIDTHILEGYTGVKTEGGRSLQNLCRLRLGIAVQVKRPRLLSFDRPGVVGGQTQTQTQGQIQSQSRTRSHRPQKGHDSYEDAMAARELLVHWMMRIPDS
ncbi:hypothetical protein Z517_00591 [Fonsecaea pedrosoi CBS 271.37]|uniref:Exonuclease domain-containing protein n=1 Tax=Fonsecaea pedrosoi CBS 271.37 TaxID=1442368 RepID=A0A0D2E525_9EURO|nr:uncharacterized protein Z517_00591 [Fonsecaea pedrosoi CBS 271.37]KIW85201.1 hypothetical protein Z517_00591 [Fonsecaea pedrosoi CBS 271.37]